MNLHINDYGKKTRRTRRYKSTPGPKMYGVCKGLTRKQCDKEPGCKKTKTGCKKISKRTRRYGYNLTPSLFETISIDSILSTPYRVPGKFSSCEEQGLGYDGKPRRYHKSRKRSYGKSKRYKYNRQPSELGKCVGKKKNVCASDPNCVVTKSGCRRKPNLSESGTFFGPTLPNDSGKIRSRRSKSKSRKRSKKTKSMKKSRMSKKTKRSKRYKYNRQSSELGKCVGKKKNVCASDPNCVVTKSGCRRKPNLSESGTFFGPTLPNDSGKIRSRRSKSKSRKRSKKTKSMKKSRRSKKTKSIRKSRRSKKTKSMKKSRRSKKTKSMRKSRRSKKTKSMRKSRMSKKTKSRKSKRISPMH